LDISVLVLAAGASSRMGRPKQLLLVSGEPLLHKTVRIALSCKANKTFVVLGHQPVETQAILEGLPVSIFIHKQWPRGMGSSIKFGLTKILEANPDTSAVLILVCDQPLLTTAHLNNLIQHYRTTGKTIIASGYTNIQGVPALFDQLVFPELLSIKDEQGAKIILEKNPEQIATVPFIGGEIDLDTPEDYTSFVNATK
jgi:molybdenum cofactor cytidylyltransferase